MKGYFDEIRKGKSGSISEVLLQPSNVNVMLTALRPYETDTLAVIRSQAYGILRLAGSKALVPDIRQKTVQRLVGACRDADGGNAGVALEYLTGFRKEDFTLESKDSIRSLFKRKNAHFALVIKLTGFLELADLKETIRPYTQPGNPQPVRWAALVSLARMSDGLAANDMMKRVRKHPVNDDVVYQLFPDLVYSRHPEAIAYMVEALNSDEKNCLTADAEREVPIPCGYRIMEQLAPIIADYPVELDESGDVKTKDYVATLQKVRAWFAKNKNYKILRDRY